MTRPPFNSNLARVILREIPENLRLVSWMNVLSAIATATLLWLVQAATQATQDDGQPGLRLVLMYVVTITLFGISHNVTLVTASHDAERLIHGFRLRLFDAVRRSDLVTVEKIGRAALNGVLVQDTQALGSILPLLVIGAQQAVMLVFLALYLAWLSPIACVLAFGFAGLAVAVRYARMHGFRKQLMETVAAEADVFDGLTDMLRGFKEVRMSRPRADALTQAIGRASARACTVNIATKTQWGRNFSLIEVMFYTLIGLMVFVVPLLTTDFHTVVVPATTAALFIVGPVSTVSFVTPMLTQAEMSLANIEAMEERLREAAGPIAAAAEPEPVDGFDNPTSIALSGARFAYRDARDNPIFAVGPLDASFHAGEISFITGGNGSGKSTMLRLLTGLMPLDEGALLVDGKPVPTAAMQQWRDNISAIFSDYHLSRRLYGVGPVTDADAAPLLERLEMRDKVSIADGCFSTTSLSTGQRKRLALVVARLEDKKVIVLDEWAADQDPHFRKIFYEELLPELRAMGKIVICVTHDDRWFHLADRAYHMNEGRLETISHAAPGNPTPRQDIM
ncbi:MULTISPECIES: cyclic peptide export ABC transporter [unclassified Azospirillum]|uniref:cyclic peptide export ABC transporter n=1 Tax=unclassified Azospirillum TaxID=2630922 RepID=UPI000B677042|nr:MULTISPECIES: cyclic peptide export ABC transporter [unclassified Azospirillum]SNT03178.1 putative ATP-binding cassette transporter [Azospirillum sp. RU38E]SNT18602.1 putative ATP-binding cassette transporter [Azospirillum sp. RU37A]